jgi:hypothetical protein
MGVLNSATKLRKQISRDLDYDTLETTIAQQTIVDHKIAIFLKLFY